MAHSIRRLVPVHFILMLLFLAIVGCAGKSERKDLGSELTPADLASEFSIPTIRAAGFVVAKPFAFKLDRGFVKTGNDESATRAKSHAASVVVEPAARPMENENGLGKSVKEGAVKGAQASVYSMPLTMGISIVALPLNYYVGGVGGAANYVIEKIRWKHDVLDSDGYNCSLFLEHKIRTISEVRFALKAEPMQSGNMKSVRNDLEADPNYRASLLDRNINTVVEIVPGQLVVGATRPGTESYKMFAAKSYAKFSVRLVRVRDSTIVKSKVYELGIGVPQDNNNYRTYEMSTSVPEDLLKEVCEYPANQVVEDFLAPIVVARPN